MIREQPKTRWDQGEFNRLARFQWKPNDVKGLSDPRLFWSYKKQVVGGVLPLSLFCGGHNYFVGQFAQRMGCAADPPPPLAFFLATLGGQRGWSLSRDAATGVLHATSQYCKLALLPPKSKCGARQAAGNTLHFRCVSRRVRIRFEPESKRIARQASALSRSTLVRPLENK